MASFKRVVMIYESVVILAPLVDHPLHVDVKNALMVNASASFPQRTLVCSSANEWPRASHHKDRYASNAGLYVKLNDEQVLLNDVA